MKTKVYICGHSVSGCQEVLRGPTVEAVIEQARKHDMEAHGKSAEEANSKDSLEALACSVREEDES